MLILCLARVPLFLFCHHRGVHPEEDKDVEVIVEFPVIHFSRQRLVVTSRASSKRCNARRSLARFS
jgi:hypothetical protein